MVAKRILIDVGEVEWEKWDGWKSEGSKIEIWLRSANFDADADRKSDEE